MFKKMGGYTNFHAKVIKRMVFQQQVGVFLLEQPDWRVLT